MADTRTCEQCGIVFTPRREHARFCSAACRIAWNQQHTPDPGAEARALEWSIAAMRAAVEQLAAQAPDQAHGFELVSDAVWRVTLVDATLVRYHPQAYEAAMRAQGRAAWQAAEGTLAGLRFVRNRMGYHGDPARFIQPARARRSCGHPVGAWQWNAQPEPVLASLPPRGQQWETERYRAYQAHLAGHSIGETFSRAAGFLNLAAADATAALPAALSAGARRLPRAPAPCWGRRSPGAWSAHTVTFTAMGTVSSVAGSSTPGQVGGLVAPRLVWRALQGNIR
jgi:hypothetical protein